ncbi:MAG: lactonase family protein [Ideonella sp.]|nr:lactonase family protein [Ideonella sp.]
MKACVYVSNADSGDIHVLHMDAHSGALTPLQQVAVGGQLMPMAPSPDRRRLYVARRSAPLAVASLAIDAASGELRLLGEAPLPDSMACIATDRSGRWLFSASYGGDCIAVSAIDAEGVAQAAHQMLATPPHAHAIQADPSNRFVLATSLGGGVVLQLRFDAEQGLLTPNALPHWQARPGAGPRHFVFHPNARWVYLLNELDAGVDLLDFDAERGTLQLRQTVSALPPGFSGEPWAADLHLTPDGRFLYASERRSSTLAAFAVDAATGALAPIGSVPTESQPRGFAIDPSGRFLCAAGQASHRLSRYAIDSSTGALTRLDGCAVGRNPNWVEVVPLG